MELIQLTDAYGDFLCRISVVTTNDSKLWYCGNCVKKFTFEELGLDLDSNFVCPACDGYVEPITEEED